MLCRLWSESILVALLLVVVLMPITTTVCHNRKRVFYGFQVCDGEAVSVSSRKKAREESDNLMRNENENAADHVNRSEHITRMNMIRSLTFVFFSKSCLEIDSFDSN